MPPIKLPRGEGDWVLLDDANQAELWRRIMPTPDGNSVTFYVVGSENTPEIAYDQDIAKAREIFARFQLLEQ